MAYQMPSMTQIIKPNIELPQFATLVSAYSITYQHGWLADTGTSQYIYNSEPRFMEFHKDKHIPALNSMDGPIRPQGYGKIILRIIKHNSRERKLILYNILYLL
jgi:hypothetical protein